MFDKFKRLKKNNSEKENELKEKLDAEGGLEKGDMAAMILSALLVFVPICLVLLIVLCVIGGFFLFF